MIGCTPKNYPAGRPFVFETKIAFKADLPADKRSDIETILYTYIDDSLKVLTKSIVGFSRVINPPVFDTANIQRSQTFIKDYLNSLGYYQATLDTFTVRFDTISRKEIRTYTRLVVNANKQERIDSVWYEMHVPELQQLALETTSKSLLKKGDGYSKQIVAQELDRLVALYRQKGYYRLTRSSLLAEADTVNPALISLENDPFFLVQQTQQRRQHPTIDIRLFQRPNIDTSFFAKYKVGRVVFYPETSIDDDKNAMLTDTGYLPSRTGGNDSIIVKQKTRMFRQRVMRRSNSIVPGQFYNEQDYYKTFNNLSQLGSWQQVDVIPVYYKDTTAADSAYKVDFNFFLTPARRYSFKTDFEGSQNIGRGSIEALTGSFFGISIVGNLLNRNFARSAIQWNSNLRAGVEINNSAASTNKNIFQTVQLTGGTSFSIPRLWPPFRWVVKKPDAGRTFLNFDGGFTSRTNFFDLRNINLSFGYEWKKNNNIFTINAANFELVDLNPTKTFQDLINSNRVLSYSFNQGVVLGFSAIFQRNIFYPKHPNQSSFLRVTAEQSGALTGKLFFKDKLLRFWKLDGEFRHSILHAKHKWAFRAIGGLGRDFSSNAKPLPFFRQFTTGGPNSMRAWRLRQLGLGNSLAQDTLRQLAKGSMGQDTLVSSNFKDRLGDIYLEGNAEYRFAMFKAFTFPIEGALFVDAGNIWARNAAIAGSDDGVFQLRHLYRDLAVDVGYGIRWDFGYLRVRLDVAYKIKDPVREGNGWLKTIEWRSNNRSTVIPPVQNKNVGFQFGIDYPF